jgi:NADPH:quinone reductase-like Zn-dependent oxidoreductase
MADLQNDGNVFPYETGFDMLEELQHPIQGYGELEFPTRDDDFCMDDTLSSISDDDQRIEKKLEQVRDRSMKNFERLEKLDKVTNGRSRVKSRSRSTSAGKRMQERRSGDLIEGVKSLEQYKYNMATEPCTEREEFDGHYMYVAYSRYGTNAKKVIQLCEHPSIPTPSSNGEVLIRVHASTVSSTDCSIRRGEWPSVPMNPYIIPGVTLVGTVQSSQKEKNKRRSSSNFSYTSPIQPGDRVLSLGTSGGNARYVCLPKLQLVKVPSHLDPDKVVCLVETYLTAFQVLHRGQKGGPRYRTNSLSGKSVLVLGGFTAFGKAIIELASVAGADHCYALASQQSSLLGEKSSDHQRREFETMAKWGAIPLSSDPQDWLTLIGRQIDVLVTVYNPSDHAKHTNELISEDHCKALRKDGHVVVVCTQPGLGDRSDPRTAGVFAHVSKSNNNNNNHSGSTPDGKSTTPFRMSPRFLPSVVGNGHVGGDGPSSFVMFDHTAVVVWYNLFDTWEKGKSERAVARKDLEHLLRLLETNRVRPDILERVPLSKVGLAQHLLDHHKPALSGHVVCAPWLQQAK